MKKITKILVILVISGALFGSLIPFILFNIANEPQSPQSPQEGYVRIYVNSTIYNSLSSELEQYLQDIETQGFKVNLTTWSNKDVRALKENITYYYNNSELVGVVLIGKVPYAQARYNDTDYGYNNYRYFPIDLYLTDLDGNWSDPDGDLTYNFDLYGSTNIWNDLEHNNGTRDIFPEIWLGRICPESLNNTNHLQAYKDYFEKNHAYRTGRLHQPHSALLYIEDSWSAWDTEYLGALTAYTNVTMVSNNLQTSRSDYLDKLTQNFEFIQLLAHSWQYEHYFDVSSTTETVNYNDILNSNTKALFYNLYCCYACDFTFQNNMGTQYLFSNNTLVVVGSTRSGGTTCYQPFYDLLKNNKCFGESLRIWFHNPENQPAPLGFDRWEECLGVTILGDPLLTIY
ncbi:MAG: hypothetical protein JW891_10350 [Candidatus Lokiarchaeota archaeon]|nr:hypothetical protein [Candidatus Lokiarchaeota archaeon]